MGLNTKSNEGVLSVFDFVQSRKYYGLQIPIPLLVETIESWWSFQKYHTDKYDSNNGFIQGRKTGLHLNFIPKFKFQIKKDKDGGLIIQLNYWARIRKTGIVAAFVTYGVSALIGAGTLSYHVMEAKTFLQAFWNWLDGSYQVFKIEVLINEERTALQDKKDNNSNNGTNNYNDTYPQPYQPLQTSPQPYQPLQTPPQVTSLLKNANVPNEPPSPSQVPIPPPNTKAGAVYHNQKTINHQNLNGINNKQYSPTTYPSDSQQQYVLNHQKACVTYDNNNLDPYGFSQKQFGNLQQQTPLQINNYLNNVQQTQQYNQPAQQQYNQQQYIHSTQSQQQQYNQQQYIQYQQTPVSSPKTSHNNYSGSSSPTLNHRPMPNPPTPHIQNNAGTTLATNISTPLPPTPTSLSEEEKNYTSRIDSISSPSSTNNSTPSSSLSKGGLGYGYTYTHMASLEKNGNK